MVLITPIVVGIAGGSGSGKTTLSRAVVDALGGAEKVTYICHDYYYKDLSHLPTEDRAQTNFDHPDALETSLLVGHLAVLKAGGSADVPTYDFTIHSRTSQTIRAEGKGVIIVEGILIFAHPDLRDLFDVKVFVDTEPDIRFIRRMQRDISQRNRTADEVVAQFLATVRPMHELFVTPSKKFCDMIVPDGFNPVVLDMIVAKLRPHAELAGAVEAGEAEDAARVATPIA
ncbi:unnamed protein product [Pylaiella littoralis]